MDTYNRFVEQLQAEINSLADYCNSYVRSSGEAPSETIVKRLQLLRSLHDNWQYIVNKNTNYPTIFKDKVSPSGSISDFVSFFQTIFIPYYGKNIVNVQLMKFDIPEGLQNDDKIHTIIYGGAFNPPTLAHLEVLNDCIRKAGQNSEVWVLLSGERRDKHFTVDSDVRIALGEALIESSDNPGAVYLNTMELFKESTVETIDTMKELDLKYPNRKFSWVFGVDSLNTLLSWHGGQWIADNADIFIIPRLGYELEIDIKNATWLDITPIEVSSTAVRNAYLNNEKISGMVPAEVLDLIHTYEDYDIPLYQE